MHRGTFLGSFACVVVARLLTSSAAADGFGTGPNAFQIEFVTIGDAGNPGDTTGNPNPAGSVHYDYRIGKYEISESMIDKANAAGGLGITKDARGPDMPATSVDWFEAARFVNWLNVSDGHAPAYKFDATGTFQLWAPGDAGYDAANLYRNTRAKYFLPSADEWYKAAYYDPASGGYYDYPTGSDNLPDGLDFVGDPDFEAVFPENMSIGPNVFFDVGALSPYGTGGQGGNVDEWEETDYDLLNDNMFVRGLRGGAFKNSVGLSSAIRTYNPPGIGENSVGFRVASVVPEPSSFVIGLLAVVCSCSPGCELPPRVYGAFSNPTFPSKPNACAAGRKQRRRNQRLGDCGSKDETSGAVQGFS